VKKVCLCITLDTFLPSPFFVSFVNMQRAGPGWEASNIIATRGVLTYQAMNQAAEGFLQTDCDYLLFLESDMAHPPDMIPRLLQHNLPVVGGIQTFKQPPFQPMIYQYKVEKLPTEVDTQQDTGPYLAIEDWERGKLIEVDGIATGCLMVKREVFERASRPWFTFAEGTQDFYFCRRVHEAGYKIYCDTSIECGHLALAMVGVADYFRGRAMK
jgi:hypothetical protein